jgi:hypothetical protein
MKTVRNVAPIQKLTSSRTNQGVEQPELSFSAGGNTKNVAAIWKTVWQFLIKLNILLPYDLAIALLRICSNELKTRLHKNMHVELYKSFIHNCQNWKQTNCLSTVVHVGKRILYRTEKEMSYPAVKRHGGNLRHIGE